MMRGRPCPLQRGHRKLHSATWVLRDRCCLASPPKNLNRAWPALFTALHCGSQAVSLRRCIWASSHAWSFRSDRLIASRLVCSLRLRRYAEQNSRKCQSNRNDFHLCPFVNSHDQNHAVRSAARSRPPRTAMNSRRLKMSPPKLRSGHRTGLG
jgi:hypothetical protein